MTKVVELGEIAEVKLGRQRSPKNHDGPQMRPYLRAANVGWSGWKLDDVASMNFSDAEMETYRLRAGDLLLGEASGSASEVGKPALWSGQIEDCAFQNTLIRVRPTELVDSHYLLHFFGHQARSGRFADRSRGAGIYHLGRKALSEWPIPLPSIDEQRRVATILSAADRLRAQRSAVLSKLGVLPHAIFDEMFANGSGPSATLFQLVEDFRYGTSGKSSESGAPALRIPNVIGGAVSYDVIKRVPATATELERLRLIDGDLLFVRSNGNPDYIGRCAPFEQAKASAEGFDEPIIYASYLIRARLDPAVLHPLVASAFFNGVAGRRALRRNAKTSAGQYNLNMQGLGSIEVPIPSVADQEAFVTRVRGIDLHARLARLQADELDTLFSALCDRAFRGEL